MSNKIIFGLFLAILLVLPVVSSITSTSDVNTPIKNDINYNLSLTYPNTTKQIVYANLELTNDSNKTRPMVLSATNIPAGISIDKKTQVIILQPNETKIIPLQINYKNTDANNLEYTLSYSNKKQIIPIIFENKKIINIRTNSLTALFLLAQNNSNTIFIVVDVILFIACIVLFTMFIGRLGNYIVRK